jgi:hypothetical protein
LYGCAERKIALGDIGVAGPESDLRTEDEDVSLPRRALSHERLSRITLFDGLPITQIDGLPTSASRLL